MDEDFKDVLYFNKGKIIIYVVIFIIIGTSLYIYFNFDNLFLKKDNKVENKVSVKSEINKEEKVEEKVEIKKDEELCFFDIKGEVNKPGVYSLSCNNRVIDAIKKAGNLTKNSDTSVINLSRKIYDSMVIVVYSKKEVNDYLLVLEKEKLKNELCNNDNRGNDACLENKTSNSTNTSSSLINLNTASLEEIMTLSGIGEGKAKKIIEYRNKTPFKKIEDVMNVEGIGESLFASIKKNITI